MPRFFKAKSGLITGLFPKIYRHVFEPDIHPHLHHVLLEVLQSYLLFAWFQLVQVGNAASKWCDWRHVLQRVELVGKQQSTWRVIPSFQRNNLDGPVTWSPAGAVCKPWRMVRFCTFTSETYCSFKYCFETGVWAIFSVHLWNLLVSVSLRDCQLFITILFWKNRHDLNTWCRI